MSFAVVLDTCVLYPAHLRDMLLRLSERALVQSITRDPKDRHVLAAAVRSDAAIVTFNIKDFVQPPSLEFAPYSSRDPVWDSFQYIQSANMINGIEIKSPASNLL